MQRNNILIQKFTTSSLWLWNIDASCSRRSCVFCVNLSYCLYVDSVPCASNFTPSLTTLISSLVFLFQQVSFYRYIHCPASGRVRTISVQPLWLYLQNISDVLMFQSIHPSSPIKSSTSSSLHPPAAPPIITGRGCLSPWLPTTESPAVCFIYSPQFGQRATFFGWHFPENPSSVLAYLFLSSCLCDFGQFWAHTLLIPHLLHGTLPLSLLSLEFNAREELWANSEQEARFPGSTAQSYKCTKNKQTEAQFSPSAYSLRLSGRFLQCLNHRPMRLFIQKQVIH